jgi:glycerate kinase
MQAVQPVLVAALPFEPQMTAAAVATEIAAGLHDAGLPEPDIYPLGKLAADFDTRMKAARAVVIAAPRLDEQTLVGSLTFEIATRARQAGVPCYAVTREDELDLFDARILDLQVVLQAGSPTALRKAGQALADIV